MSVIVSLCMKPALEMDPVGDNILCKERERRALLDIKDDLVDDYGSLSFWGSEEEDTRDCCNWSGITCSNRTGHVTKLDLSGYYMRGKINPSLLELGHLVYLDLSSNDFEGTQFPNNKNGPLLKLRSLRLVNANFGGLISSTLANLSQLEYLDLRYNSFLDLDNSEWLTYLSSLRYLDLSWSPLSRPNDWLRVVSKMGLLEYLSLSHCFDPGATLGNPSPINSSSSLRTVYLSYNGLVVPSLLPWLSNVTLIDLDLSSNLLHSSTLADIGHMVYLQSLYLYNTALLGGIPKSFRNLSSLSSLDLSANNFTGQLSEVIQNLSGESLEYLDLWNNTLTGSLPDFTRFSSLIYLNLAYNHLNGTINESIGRLSKLYALDLSKNSLYGVVSKDFFSNLSGLTWLGFSHNSLILNVSLDWVPPFRLDIIYLASCKLGPRFPKWLQKMKNYTYLDLSSNGISDSVPTWFWNLSLGPVYLNLSHNNLNGMLPHSLSNFNESQIIDLSHNSLHGSLPLLLFPLIRRLDLSNNMFSSSLLSLCGITSSTIEYLFLSNNLLWGKVPECFTRLQGILLLDLANNNLSGEIPTSIGLLSELDTLSLRNNSLSGDLPLSLKNCNNLRFIDVSDNQLSGTIPFWIGGLSSLLYLSLRSNQFQGSIPLQVCQLMNVQILDLSANSINGTIPHCLNNLSSMVNGTSTKTIGSELGARYIDSIWYYNYINNAMLLWKGKRYLSDKNLGLFRIIDFSNNQLEGQIPKEISTLSQLKQMNLSENRLTGSIPQEIGDLKEVESLDLSRNQLSGSIPTSMARLNFLNTLNLSYNNLSGRIPSSTQLQSFNASIFTGNPALCGLPLPQKCPEDNVPQVPPTNTKNQGDQDSGNQFRDWFYIGLATGFTISICGVSTILLLKRSWRQAYFRVLDKLASKFTN